MKKIIFILFAIFVLSINLYSLSNIEEKFINACLEGNKRFVERYIKNKEDLNVTDYQYNNTGLIYAIHNGYYDIAKILIDAGADINKQNKLGGTALSVAAFNKDKEILKLLIDNNVNLNSKLKKDGHTPLICASHEDNTDIVKILVEASADVNIKDNDNMTALNYAVYNNNYEIAEILINKGADCNIIGSISSDYINGMKFVSEFIPLIYTLREKTNISMAKLLIKGGADCNISTYIDGFEVFPLALSIMLNDAELTEIILNNIKNKEDLNKTIEYNGTEYTILDIAKEINNEKINKLLEEAGAISIEKKKSIEKEANKINVINNLPDNFNIYEMTLSNNYLSGILLNNNKDYLYLSIYFTFYDKDGNRIGDSIDNIRNFSKGEKWKFNSYLLLDSYTIQQIKTIKISINGIDIFHSVKSRIIIFMADKKITIKDFINRLNSINLNSKQTIAKTLNKIAFEAQKEARNKTKEEFTVRNNYAISSIIVKKASELNLKSVMGSTAEYQKYHEEGKSLGKNLWGQSSKINPLATLQARENSQKNVLPSQYRFNRMGHIRQIGEKVKKGAGRFFIIKPKKGRRRSPAIYERIDRNNIRAVRILKRRVKINKTPIMKDSAEKVLKSNEAFKTFSYEIKKNLKI